MKIKNIHSIIDFQTAVDYLLWAQLNCRPDDFKRVAETVILRVRFLTQFENCNLYVNPDRVEQYKNMKWLS